jgi:hypothetical protein
MTASHQAGLIDSSDLDSWKAIVEVRNALVHNNGTSDCDLVHALDNGPTVRLTKGRMAQGNLRFFPELMLWSIEAFGRWSGTLLTRG